MNWVIVGQGALGSLLAVKLQQQQQTVAVLTRANAPAEPRWLDQQCYQFSAITPAELLCSQQPSTVVAAVKAYQLDALLKQLAELPTQHQLLLSYNGMLDNEAQQLPPNCLHWVTTHGAYRDAQQLVHAGAGESWLGWQQPQLKPVPAELVATLSAALPPCHWQPEIQRQRWQKLAINCLINPFTVIHNCLNGELLDLGLEAEMLQLAGEISALAGRLDGIDLLPEQLVTAAIDVATRTAANRSSMLSDVRAGRRTEIDFLNGFVARQSAQLGLTASANQLLWQQLS
ncbi:MAG: 2-dehydropantoate 2-reductase [Pseudidiomarina mangrovi]|nr:MAG: 2-dehydropantoate 2-reductase [Pseudidiomarina mangrovi]